MQQTFAAQSCPAFYADNEPKSALARDLGDCRDNKGKLAKCVFTCYRTQRERTETIFHRKRGMHI